MLNVNLTLEEYIVLRGLAEKYYKYPEYTLDELNYILDSITKEDIMAVFKVNENVGQTLVNAIKD